MKVVTAFSHKGGTGKTTSLAMIANAAATKQERVLLIDADVQQSFSLWKALSDQDDLWVPNFSVKYFNFQKTNIATMEDFLLEANESGDYDLCLMNLAGVEHPFNRMAIRYAEVVLLPFKPALVELQLLEPAIEEIKSLSQEGEVGQYRLVFSSVPSKSKMTVEARDYMKMARDTYPCLETEIAQSAIFQNLLAKGVLNKSIQRAREGGASRDLIQIPHYETALDNCVRLYDEVKGLM